MRWEGNRESDNVEDRRDSGGGGGFGIGGGGLGIGAVVIAIVGGAIFGINPLTILSMLLLVACQMFLQGFGIDLLERAGR